MRIGLLGTGRMAEIHATSLRRHIDIEVIVGSSDADRAGVFAREHGYTESGTFASVLTSRLDGLIITTRTSQHAEQLNDGSTLGIPVFCEKPITLDLGSAKAMVDRYAALRVPLQVGLHRRFDPGFRALRDAIATGSVGDIYSIVLTARDHDLPPEGYIATSGGVFRDMHIHDFDSVLWLAQTAVRRVSAFGVCVTGGEISAAGDADVTSIVLELANGALATIVGGRRNPSGYDTRAEVYGSRDSLALGLGPTLAARRLDADWPMQTTWDGFAARYAEAYDGQVDSFLALCSGGGENEAPAQAAVDALAIAEFCERSVRTGASVTVEKGNAE